MKSNELRYFTLPNIITLLGLLAGSIAIFYATNNPNRLAYASYFIGIALVFDFLDGMTARLLDKKSKIGKELDSLSDLVSFGVAPAVVAFQLLKSALKIKSFNFDLPFEQALILLSPTILILAAALRLAKYNTDTRQTGSFLGLPTPTTAAFFAIMPIIKDFDPDKLLIFSQLLDIVPFKAEMAIIGFEIFIMESIWFYLPFILLFSILMIVEFPMFSLKFNNLTFKENRIRYIFLITSFILVILFQTMAVPNIVFLYILLSVIQNIRNRKHQPVETKTIAEADGLHFADLLPELKSYDVEIKILSMSEIIQKKSLEALNEIKKQYKDITYNIRSGNYICMRIEAESEEVAELHIEKICKEILEKHGIKDAQYTIKKNC